MCMLSKALVKLITTVAAISLSQPGIVKGSPLRAAAATTCMAGSALCEAAAAAVFGRLHSLEGSVVGQPNSDAFAALIGRVTLNGLLRGSSAPVLCHRTLSAAGRRFRNQP